MKTEYHRRRYGMITNEEIKEKAEKFFRKEIKSFQDRPDEFRASVGILFSVAGKTLLQQAYFPMALWDDVAIQASMKSQIREKVQEIKADAVIQVFDGTIFHITAEIGETGLPTINENQSMEEAAAPCLLCMVETPLNAMFLRQDYKRKENAVELGEFSEFLFPEAVQSCVQGYFDHLQTVAGRAN